MLTSQSSTPRKLAFFVIVSILFGLVWPAKVVSHEVVPTISDLSISAEGDVIWSLHINLEAFLAGIDLDAVGNTDDDAAGEDYDALRALSAEELEPLIETVVNSFNSASVMQSVGGSNEMSVLAFEADSVSIPNDLSFELPRISSLTLRATAPEGVQALVVNWPVGNGALVLRQQGVDAPYTGYLEGGQSSPPVDVSAAAAASVTQTITSYFEVGFKRVWLGGVEHLLFALGLFLFSSKRGPVIAQTGVFTLAFFVTLTLGALGWVSIPDRILVPLIAVSIAYIAADNLLLRSLSRSRLIVIFGVGLLHGFGFVSGLENSGVPDTQFVYALAGYGIGIEIALLAAMAAAFFTLTFCAWIARVFGKTEIESAVAQYPVMFRTVSIVGSFAMMLAGLYWCFSSFFP